MAQMALTWIRKKFQSVLILVHLLEDHEVEGDQTLVTATIIIIIRYEDIRTEASTVTRKDI